jgi:hypothetical protein
VSELIVPQADQAERAVLGCLLFDPARALEVLRASGLCATDFGNPQLGAILSGALELADSGNALDGITLFRRLAERGVSHSLLSDLIGPESFAPLDIWCALIRETASKRALQNSLARALEAINNGEAVDEVVTGLGEAVAIASAAQGLGDIIQTDFEELLDYDTTQDPNSLIGNRWLCKGGSFLLNAQSGIGKSSLTMQLAIGWALSPENTFGQHCTFSMRAARPLKSLIIQAENDIGDQADVLQGVIKKYPKSIGHPLSQDEMGQLQDRIMFYRDNIHAGSEFLRVLEALVIRHQPDLVWIDPLMCYIGDDLSDQGVVTAFCNALNRISSKSGCVMCLIHHLPKPKEGAVRTDSDLAYSGFGSSALTNWAREVATMQRVEAPEDHPPCCSLTMTKRRNRAGLKDYKGNGATSRIYIRHPSDPKTTGTVWIACAQPEKEQSDSKRRK